jgi:outer membrane protein
MARRFCIFMLLLLAPLEGWAQVDNSWVGRLRRPYQASTVPDVAFKDSNRIDSLLRAGQLYLSLQDAIALALENNLDIELQRFAPAIARTDVRRAQGGGTLRGVPLSVRELPAGVGGPGAPLLTTVGGYNPTASVSPNIGELGGISAQERTLSVLGTSSPSAGPRLPAFDPSVVGGLNLGRSSTPQYNGSFQGVNPLQIDTLGGNFGVQRGFSSGTSVSLGYNSLRQSGNWTRADFNPYTTASLGLTVTQRLLQGFSVGVNRRYIRIANNNLSVSDYVFKEQVISTISSVIRLYWDLVSLNEDVKVKRNAMKISEKLLENNTAQVEVGTLAPIEVKRARAEVARFGQDVTNSENLLAQQELVLKRVLTRNGLGNPSIREAHIVPLDRIEIPAQDDVQPVQDLVSQAFRSRPDLAEARLQIENSNISLKASRNALLPALDLVGSLQNNALAGQANGVLPPLADPYFLGGAGNLLSQVFAHNFPNYTVGVQLSIPLTNRVAQADAVRDQLDLRQAQVRLRNVEEQVRLEIESALIALTRSRTAYEAASQTRQLQEEALEAERERYAVGASTSFFIIQYERDLTQAQTTEVIARGNYAKARAALDRALGATLDKYNIQLTEARSGVVSTPPRPLPQ